jgi:HD-GYP domain-containing protein (c-di-GMP phosphodiesterase class II)
VVDYPLRLKAIAVGLLVLSGSLLALVGPTLWIPEFDWKSITALLLLIVALFIAEHLSVDLPITKLRITVSVGAALSFAAILTFGPLVGTLVAVTGSLLEDLIDRRDPIKMVVNTANFSLSSLLAGWLYFSIADLRYTPIATLHNFATMLMAAAAFSLVQATLLSIVLSQAGRTSFWHLWKAAARGLLIEFLALPALGALYPVLARENPLALVLMIVPLLGPYFAFRNYRQLHHETQATFELLADLLDRRDPYTSEHSQRVAHLVEQILQQFPDLPSEEVETILSAARIHDLGKIGTTDLVLSKPGRLTDEEFAAIKRHPIEGSELLRRLTPYRRVVEIVRHHHERWDGTGYPDGLAGEQIPFGSRVIAVADTYDAMTSDRPYRRALSSEQALAEIRRCAGTQFDPVVVAAFERAVAATVPTRHLVAGVVDIAQSATRSAEF